MVQLGEAKSEDHAVSCMAFSLQVSNDTPPTLDPPLSITVDIGTTDKEQPAFFLTLQHTPILSPNPAENLLSGPAA